MPYFTEGVLTLPLGDRARVKDEYMQWRGEVLATVFLPEYKLKRLWRENYSVKDIQGGKHYEIWPRMNPLHQAASAMDRRPIRRLSWHAVQIRVLGAMRDELKRCMDRRRMDAETHEKSVGALADSNRRIAGLRKLPMLGETVPPVARVRDYLDLWQEHLLAIGTLPSNPVSAAFLLQMIREFDSQLSGVSSVMVGRYLRYIGAVKRHTTFGNTWRFDSLAECRKRWEQIHGSAQWPNDFREWQK